MSVSPSEISLDTGERTLWSGSPPTGIMFRPSDWFAVPFGFLWLALVITLTGSLTWIRAAKPPPHALPLIFFIGFGLYATVGRFFWDAYVRRQTSYALTNKRAIILIRGPFRRLRSVELTAVTKIEVVESGDGSGSILFGEPQRPRSSGQGWPNAANSGDFVFERVSDVRSVAGVVRNVQSKS